MDLKRNHILSLTLFTNRSAHSIISHHTQFLIDLMLVFLRLQNSAENRTAKTVFFVRNDALSKFLIHVISLSLFTDASHLFDVMSTVLS